MFYLINSVCNKIKAYNSKILRVRLSKYLADKRNETNTTFELFVKCCITSIYVPIV